MASLAVSPQITKPRVSNVFWEQPDQVTVLRDIPLQRPPLTNTNTWAQSTI